MLSSPRLTGWGSGTALLDYGDRWRGQRRITHEVLQKKALESIWPAIVKQTRLSMRRLSNTMELESEIARMVGATIMQSTYGYEAIAADDPMIEIGKAGMRGFSDASMPGDFFVNLLPLLKFIPSWLPGAEWKRKAMGWSKAREDLINIPFNWTKQQMAAGTAQPSVLNSILTSLASDESVLDQAEEEDRVKWAVGSLYGGAMDTTTSSILVFIIAMIRNPDVQAKAQEEVDVVVGDQRLPQMEDQANLPYISRIIKEVLRWRPVAPLGVPHACVKDDIYKGYFIPKGAVVMGNAWAMCCNPELYSDPERFNPDRFEDPMTPDPPAFGFGRRICPGQHFAEASLFLAIATMLFTFNIEPAKDEQGNIIIPDARLTGMSLIRIPPRFQCSIKARSDAKRKLLF
ncbi:cytochrome P450 [Rhizoctonia solani]|nr:cytochrome P450 [Rhizoctonia solani]